MKYGVKMAKWWIIITIRGISVTLEKYYVGQMTKISNTYNTLNATDSIVVPLATKSSNGWEVCRFDPRSCLRQYLYPFQHINCFDRRRSFLVTSNLRLTAVLSLFFFLLSFSRNGPRVVVVVCSPGIVLAALQGGSISTQSTLYISMTIFNGYM